MYTIEEYDNAIPKDRPEPERYEKNVVERDMYVVNLNVPRIAIIALILIAALGVVFLTGVIIGTNAGNRAKTARVTMPYTSDALETQVVSPPPPTMPAPVTEAPKTTVAPPPLQTADADADADAMRRALERADAMITANLDRELEVGASSRAQTPERSQTLEEIGVTSKPVSQTKPHSASSTPAKGTTIYFIQVAVSSDAAIAERERAFLKAKFPKTFSVEDVIKGQKVYKLKIGRFATRAEAETTLKSVRAIPAYKDSYIYADTAR